MTLPQQLFGWMCTTACVASSLWNSARGDGEERLVPQLRQPMELDDHDPELAEQRRRRGQQRLVLGAFDVHLQQQLGIRSAPSFAACQSSSVM